MNKERKTENKNLSAVNVILKEQIEHAQHVIEQQNTQISKMTGHFQLFYGITAVILVVIGFFVTYQFIKPAKELQKESRAILDDLKGGMKEVFEEKYEEIEKEKFDASIEELKFGDHRSKEQSMNIIRDRKIVGFKNGEISKIIEFIDYSEVNDNPNDGLNMNYLELLETLSKQKSSKELDVFFDRYIKKNDKMYLGNALYYYINNNSSNYKDELFKIFEIKGENGNTFFLTSFLINIEKATSINANNIEILNNKEFVDELRNLGLLTELLETHKRYQKKKITESKTIHDQWPVLKRNTYLKKRIDKIAN